jgi:FAD/FMN-containing dehydrogenase
MARSTEVPIGVLLPRTVDAAVAAAGVCRSHDVPLLSRGGGTSLAGQCTNTAVVIDWSKYCHRAFDVDREQQTCVVEPGIVLDILNDELKESGLRFGPEPATHMNCTIGGMIGNNSCGATAQRTGKVVDNIAALEVLLYDGTRFWCGPTIDESPRCTATSTPCWTGTPRRDCSPPLTRLPSRWSLAAAVSLATSAFRPATAR